MKGPATKENGNNKAENNKIFIDDLFCLDNFIRFGKSIKFNTFDIILFYNYLFI